MKFVGIINKDLVFEIDDVDGEYIIGRAEDCDIVMNFKGVSSQHCRLFIRDNQYALIDLGSSNGTAVNGNRIKRKVLHPKDIVQIGAEKFNVILPEAAQKLAIQKQKEAEESAENAEFPKTEMVARSSRSKKQTQMTRRETKAPRTQIKPKTEQFQADKVPTKFGGSMLWLIIFIIGGVLGIALFIVGMAMKSGVDDQIKTLQNEITALERDKSADAGKINLLKEKLAEIRDSIGEFKTFVDDISNETYQSQRNVSSEIDEFKNGQAAFNDRIADIQSRLDDLQEKIEDVNNK